MRYGENVRLSTEKRMSGGCADGDSGGENYFHFRCEQFEMTVGYACRIVMSCHCPGFGVHRSLFNN